MIPYLNSLLIFRLNKNWVLRKILGPKREDVAEDWRRMHNEELHKLYASPDISRVIKSMRMRWAGNIACMGTKRRAYKILIGGKAVFVLNKAPCHKDVGGVEV
jgi:hypothetical protein